MRTETSVPVYTVLTINAVVGFVVMPKLTFRRRLSAKPSHMALGGSSSSVSFPLYVSLPPIPLSGIESECGDDRF